MQSGIYLRSVLIHEGNPFDNIASDPPSFLLFNLSCRYSIYFYPLSFKAFQIFYSLISLLASLFLLLGLLSRGFGLDYLRSQIHGTPDIRNSLRIYAWQRLLMGNYSRICPGITLLNASSIFLTQNNLVQVINITVKYINQSIFIWKQLIQLPMDLRIIFTIILVMKGFIILVLVLVFFTTVNTVEVSLDNLKGFFWATYDRDDDGAATVQQFVNYFRFMQPQYNITQEDILPVHQFFDSNQDKKVTLRQLIQVAKIKVTTKNGHKQIHLGLTNKDGQMQVMWVSTPQIYQKPIVQYGRLPTALKYEEAGSYTTYNVGHLGFHGRIYRAVMKGLQPLKKYYYRVGDANTRTFSKIKHFNSAPYKVQTLEQLNIAVVADMGTFAPFGHFVINQIAKDQFIKPFDFVFFTGDIAYAGMNSQKVGQFEPIWDLYGELTESFAAYTPFMPGVGNHQKYYNYTSYSHRYVLPRQNQSSTNLWFSFDYGQIHIVHFSSEHPYNLTSQQFKFLDEDLAKARRNPNTQWIIVGAHRFFYSSSKFEHSDQTNLVHHLEDLMVKHKVDIVQTGHVHDYERSWPTYKGKAMKKGANKTHYVDPEYPVYAVQGTGGALIDIKYVSPAPQWSAKKSSSYGYGKIKIQGGHLRYQYVTIPGGKVLDEWHIIKNITKYKSFQTK